MDRKPTRCTPSIRSSSIEGGFTLIELLAAICIALLAFAGASTLMAATQHFSHTQTLRIETVQALRASIDTVTRDIRLAGACMPTGGDFSPFDGTNTGTTDTVTMRTGLVRPSLTCITYNLGANAATSLTLSSPTGSISGFQVGMGAYIYSPQTGTGQDFIITSISGLTLGSDTAMNQAYSSQVGALTLASVYASEKRTYKIDSTTNPNVPVLTVAINGGTAIPFASGIEAFDIQYRLFRNCPPCDTVLLPTTTADWQLVNELIFNVTARSQSTDVTGNYYRRSAQFIAKPRNLIATG
jgi:prepilin-type N-terminal cleavage/methylation domain-containing protein